MKLNILSVLFIIILTACAPHHPPITPTASPYAAKPNPHPYASLSNVTTKPYVSEPSASLIQSQQAQSHKEVKVGLLLPLSGANAKLGQNMLDAAMLGLFDKYALSPNITRIMLLPKNTGDSTKGALKVAQDAINDGAQLLLGSLDSASTQAIKPIAFKAGVDIISFSNDTSVAGDVVYDGAYLMGFMAQEQITHIVAHIAKQGKQHLAVMLPSDDNTTAIEAMLSRAIKAAGFKDSTIVKYSANNFSLVATQLKNAIANKQQPADAVLLLEGGERLVQLVASLKAQGLATSYYGTGLLDNQALLGVPDLVGVEFSSTSARSFQQFARRFEHEYGYSPSKISSLGYDATAIAAEIFSGSSITRPQGFIAPANGLIRFNSDGTNQRSLAIMRIEGGAFKEISPSKRMF